MVSWSEPNATDLSGIPRRIPSHTPGSEFLLGSTRVTYVFVDMSNNTANCTFLVTVETVDTTPPVVTQCPSDFLSVGGRHISWIEPTAFDLSEDVTVFKSHLPGMFITSPTDIVYTFVDSSENKGYCNFTVSLIDDGTPPMITECSDDIDAFAEIGNSGTPVYWAQPTATDDNERVMLLLATHTPGEMFPIGETLVLYTFADDSFNIARCNFTITVREVDTNPPVIHSCPSDITKDVAPDTFSTPVYWSPPSAIDVSGNVTLASQSHHPGDPFAVGETNVDYLFIDGSNNEALCSFSVNIKEVFTGNTTYLYTDTTSPVIIYCPVDIYEYAELGTSQLAVNWIEPTAFDQHGTITLMNSTHKSGDLFLANSTTEVSYLFVDDSHNSASCSFSVTVTPVDTTPPAVDYCPDDITGIVELGVTTAIASWRDPQASDLSGNVTVSDKSRIPTVFSPLKNTLVNYIFTDDSGNEATCSFHVSFVIVDSTPPEVLSCPPDIQSSMELGMTGTAVFWNYPSVTDLSGIVQTTSIHLPGQIFPPGLTFVKYVFEDPSLNSATCNFTIYVTPVDTTQPSVNYCPDDIIKTIEIGKEHRSISWAEPIVSDNSGNVSLSYQSHFSGNNFVAGNTSIMYVFVDGSGNSASCDFEITLMPVDTERPDILQCPSDIHYNVEIGSTLTAVSWTEPSASDESGNVILLVKTHSTGEHFGVGKTTVTYLFVDSSNNMATCSFNIIGNGVDTQPPEIINCPSDVHKYVPIGTSKVLIRWNEPSASDNSGYVTIRSASHRPGDLFPIGSTLVSYTYVDGSNNSISCNFTISVSQVDAKRPEIMHCPSDIFTDVEIGSSGTVVTWTEPSITDDSGNVTLLVKTHSPGAQFGIGRTTVTYLFADSSDNMATCNFHIIGKGVDMQPPEVINCPQDVHKRTEIGTPPVLVQWNDPLVSDNSGFVTIRNASHMSGDLFSVGSTRVSYVYTDRSNNSVTCNFTILVSEVDTKRPEILHCPSDIPTDVEIGSTGTAVTWIEPSATDESGNSTVLVKTHSSGQQFGVGKTTVTYLFADTSNNVEKCSFQIIGRSVDTTPPEIEICPRDINAVTELGNMRKTVYWTQPKASDSSGNVALSRQSHYSGDDFPIGMTEISYEYIDGTGNAAWCNFSVVVNTEDTIAPTITYCPSNVVAKVEEGSMSAQVSWKEPSAMDASGNATLLVKTHQSGEKFGIGANTVMYIFADNSNNMAFCTFSIEVNSGDIIPPDIEFCPLDIYKTVEIGTPHVQASWEEPRASDKSGHVFLVNATHGAGDVFKLGSTLVRYTFVDGANNSATCQFHVLVSETDSQAPTILFCPSNMTVELDQGSNGAIVNWKEPVVEDASGYAMLLIQTHVSGTFFTMGTTIVSYIFRDNANNMEKCSFTVTLTRGTGISPMIFNCPSNIVTRVEPGRDSTSVTWSEPYAINLSAAATISSNHKTNESFPIGSTPVVYTFEDSDGYKEFCNFTVVVLENDYSPGNGAVNRFRQSEGSDGGTGVSYAALVLSLLVILLVIFVVLVIVYYRRKTKNDNITLEGLAMSTTSSLKSINL
ncbi:hyalin-like isoform X2 [Amphiura filiformis]|uniref:hyalin-like isoform X2 n=1 Tax=Amphiura filiformis TaxID=82378 RepID=UPI003B211AA5